MDSNSSDTEPHITDVTDAYHPLEESCGGEESMEDAAAKHPEAETVVTFPPESEFRRRADLAVLSKDALIEIIIEKEKQLRKRSKLIQRLRQSKADARRSSVTTSSSEDEAPLHAQPGTSSSSETKNGVAVVRGKKRKIAKHRELDFSAYGKRHVALLFSYLGWDYQGFVVQDDTNNTVEDHIFNALSKTKLIESRESSMYHRCGRTDKSVSAFSQVISLNLRSNSRDGLGLISPATDAKASDSEIPYVQMLNGVLPKNIRVISWSPVEVDFSARFSCGGRKYRYYFPRAHLDLERMSAAAKLLLGEHDFRNFCKADINGGVTNYTRRIDAIFISELHKDHSPYQICVLHVYGSGFLWHQVRSIAAVLFLIGQKREDPQVITELLDVVECPGKPQYAMAEGFPLVLFGCEFEDVTWSYDEFSLRQTIKELDKIWTEHAIKAAIITDMLRSLKHTLRNVTVDEDLDSLIQALVPENKVRNYQKLRTRRTCDTIENRLFKRLKVT